MNNEQQNIDPQDVGTLNPQPSNLQQAIADMRNMQQSYDQLASAAEAYNTGKPELAANLIIKGVQASATETLPELAAKVRDIAQTTTEIVGGEMYGAQIFGDANPAQSPLWNLYDVLAEMKTRFMGAGQYAALIVCEYYKGYDSLQLQGADAYYTCDGDLYDTSMPLHVWHDSDNGRINRWVCFLFTTAGARLDITNTAISPRSMYIGGHIGTIEYFVNGRLTELVCGIEETDVLDKFIGGFYTQDYNRNTIIKVGDATDLNLGSVNFAVVKLTDTGIETLSSEKVRGKFNAIVFEINKTITIPQSAKCLIFDINKPVSELTSITIKGDVRLDGYNTYLVLFYGIGYNISAPNLQYIDMRDVTYMRADAGILSASSAPKLIDFWVGAMTSNLRFANWNPTSVLADADQKAQLIDNIKNHILARVSDATGSTQLVFTVSTNMYNAIASETITWNDETMTLADAFLTKNWLLAGA